MIIQCCCIVFGSMDFVLLVVRFESSRSNLFFFFGCLVLLNLYLSIKQTLKYKMKSLIFIIYLKNK